MSFWSLRPTNTPSSFFKMEVGDILNKWSLSPCYMLTNWLRSVFFNLPWEELWPWRVLTVALQSSSHCIPLLHCWCSYEHKSSRFTRTHSRRQDPDSVNEYKHNAQVTRVLHFLRQSALPVASLPQFPLPINPQSSPSFGASGYFLEPTYSKVGLGSLLSFYELLQTCVL